MLGARMPSSRVFISYSHKDESWKDRLVTHLSVLQRQGVSELWDDRLIRGGDVWLHEIEKAIAAADVAILLISADFLSSQFILRKEIPLLLKKLEEGGLHILPLLVKPCLWNRVDWLSRLQIRPLDGRPLASGTEYQIEMDLVALVGEVADILDARQRAREEEAQVQHEAAQRDRRAAEERAQREAEERAQRAAAERAQRAAEERARRERAEREADERARRDAEEKARRAEEEAARRREAEDAARRRAEEEQARRREAEERARKDAEEKARRADEEAARRRAEEDAAHRAEEARARREAKATQRAKEEAARRAAEEAAARRAEREAAEKGADDASQKQGGADDADKSQTKFLDEKTHIKPAPLPVPIRKQRSRRWIAFVVLTAVIGIVVVGNIVAGRRRSSRVESRGPDTTSTTMSKETLDSLLGVYMESAAAEIMRPVEIMRDDLTTHRLSEGQGEFAHSYYALTGGYVIDDVRRGFWKPLAEYGALPPNFRIETSMTLDAPGSTQAGFCFGNTGSGWWELDVDTAGRYSFRQFTTQATTVIPWTYSVLHLNQGSPARNDLAIELRGQDVTLYANGAVLSTARISPLDTMYMGIAADPGIQSATFHYFRTLKLASS
jgi:hypothetical protein